MLVNCKILITLLKFNLKMTNHSSLFSFDCVNCACCCWRNLSLPQAFGHHVMLRRNEWWIFKSIQLLLIRYKDTRRRMLFWTLNSAVFSFLDWKNNVSTKLTMSQSATGSVCYATGKSIPSMQLFLITFNWISLH